MNNMQLGFGTAAIGRPQYINIKSNPSRETFNKAKFIAAGEAVLNKAYALGIRHFDTAPGYGIAEQILLKWIQKHEIKDISVSTKWGYTYTADFNPNATVHEVKEHSISKLQEQWAFSKKLRPHLKAYQIHSATLDTGVLDNQDVLNFLNDIKQQNNIKIGLSTSGTQQKDILEKAISITMNGCPLFEVFQVTYNIFEQSLKNIIEQSNRQFIIKEGLANGRLLPNKSFPHYQNAYQTISRIARKHVVGEDAIALGFCAQSIPKSLVLSGAGNNHQLQENLKSTQVKLTAEDLQLLNQLAINKEDYWQERSRLPWQ